MSAWISELRALRESNLRQSEHVVELAAKVLPAHVSALGDEGLANTRLRLIVIGASIFHIL